MLFTNKKEATLLLVLAVALGIFLVAGGGTLAAGHSPKLMSAVAPLAANPGIDAACQPALMPATNSSLPPTTCLAPIPAQWSETKNR